MKEGLFGTEEVRISRPVKQAEMRIRGFDNSITSEEIATRMADIGSYSSLNVIVGRIRMAQQELETV